MKNQISMSLLCCSVLASFSYAQVLPTQQIQSFTCNSCESLSKEPLHLEWQTKNQTSKSIEHPVYKSKSYSLNISGAQLRQGITLPISSKQPIISIGTDKLSTISFPIYIKLKNNSHILLKDAADESFVNENKHQSAIPAFMLKSTYSHQPIRIYAPDAKDQNYRIYVHEPFSSIYLAVNLESNHYQYGDKIHAWINLEDKIMSYPIDKIEVNLVAPDGTASPMMLSKNNTYQYEATAIITSKINSEGANWLVHAMIESNHHDQHIVRQAASAFSYAIPTVSMKEVVVTRDGSKAKLKFKTTFSHAGRYMLQADVYKKSNKQVVSTVQDAQWFNEGEQNWTCLVDLPKDADEEYYLNALTITDVAQLKPVYQPKTKININ